MMVQKSISRTFSVLLIIALMLAVAPHQTVQAADVLFAKPTASGTGDCTSWANACILQTALTSAVSGDEIWVAAGTYKPTTGADRSATFQLINGVAAYGGFVGTETAREQRDPIANLTIMSGDIDNNDSQTPIITEITTVTGNDNNSYNVVTGATGATLDGFTITAGYANGGTCPNIDCYGGGMNNYSSSPELTNIIFSGNWATYGGGMFNENSHPLLTKVTFSNNSVQYGGGGMFGQSGSSPTLTAVTFTGNSANKGGGMFNHNSSNPTLTNVTFSENSADEGGGLFNQVSSNPELINVTFSSNLANKGGAMYNSGSSPTMTNVTFSGNSAVDHGGGMYIADLSYPQFRNTIFWGNTAAGGIGAQIYNFSGNTTSSDSIVQGGCADTSWSCGTNIITTDPKLGALGDYGGFNQTIPLLAGSSAIDTGNDATCSITDQRGVPRPQGAHCDIGAFEFEPQTLLMAVPGGLISGLCESWTNACELRYALASAISGQEIWVAAGTYKPTSGTDRSATFQLIGDVALYGGFAGTETTREKRDPAANVTILSGDLNSDDVGFTNNTENVYHVVTGASGATLDGFTITAGNANVADVMNPDGNGGGMLNNSGSSPILTNLIFSGNTTAYYGGGMLNWNSSNPTLMDVSFNGNLAGSDGGGMFNWNSSSPTLTNVTFNGNMALVGGGIYNYMDSNPTLTNVTFVNNSAPTISGGGMYNYQSSPTLMNVTFTGNWALNYGGGMFNEVGSNPQIRNSIFWGNTAASQAQIYTSSSTPIVSDSVVQGGYADGTNIITADPMLGTLGDYGGFTQTIPLLPGSSAINTGNDAVCPATDQRGLSRPQGAHCDIGAFELRLFNIFLPLILR